MGIRRTRAVVSSRRALFGFAAVVIGACSGDAEQSTAESEGAIGLPDLFRVAINKVDRTTPDPSNPWAKKDLALGEENILPTEAAEFADLANRVEKLMNRVKSESGARDVVRGFHAKGHACVAGEITFDVSTIPKDARVGVLKENGTKPAWIRFSNGAGGFQSDRKVDVRSLAIKILNVDGPRLRVDESDAKARTQDFLFTNGSINIAADPRHFVELGEAFQGARDGNSILGRFGNMIERGGFLLRPENVRMLDYIAHHVAVRSQQVGSYLQETFWTAAPLAMGVQAGDPNTARATRAAKLKIVGGILHGDECRPVIALPNPLDADYFRSDLARRLRTQTACFDLFVQYQRDPRRDPVEDVSVEWTAGVTKVGRITIPPVDLDDPNTPRESFCNELTFTPWHTLVDHDRSEA
jgi:hypothetical protein